jgi:hypothetical protein
MDDDAGIEVWSAPVWKAKTTVTADSVSKTIVHVSTWVTTASPHVTVFDFIGTEEVNRQYTYDLEGYYDSAQNFQVTSGVWTNRSRWDHPDYVIPLPSQLVRASLNTKIDPKVVDDILRH